MKIIVIIIYMKFISNHHSLDFCRLYRMVFMIMYIIILFILIMNTEIYKTFKRISLILKTSKFNSTKIVCYFLNFIMFEIDFVEKKKLVLGQI